MDQHRWKVAGFIMLRGLLVTLIWSAKVVWAVLRVIGTMTAAVILFMAAVTGMSWLRTRSAWRV